MTQESRFASYPSLRDRVVLVTGGGSGIGASIVEHFAMQGAKVAFVDVAEDCSVELVKALASRVGHAPMFLKCDLTDVQQLRSAVDRVKDAIGSPTVLVNNAANDDRHNFAEVTPEYWDERMNVNVKHQFFAAQAVMPGMAASGGGSIINMSSIAWMIPSVGMPVYVMAKAAVIALTRTLAKEYGPSNIRVNAIAPGAILTERQRRLWFTPEYTAMVMGNQALKRHLMPEEVARLILFLASDDSSAITNQCYVIDGGWV